MPVRKKLRKLIARLRADTPWMSSMTDKYGDHAAGPDGAAGNAATTPKPDPNPTIAAFAPGQHGSTHTRNRSSVLIHQKSPLLLATPPQVTRALAYSHPFLLPLNQLAGLVSWTTGDPWESFLMVALFWFTVLYSDVILRYAGPLVLIIGLILGMYMRRYSPLSSTMWSGEKKKGRRKRAGSEEPEQRKSLDEILETLQSFTARCNILLDPLLRLTDFLSTQTTATAATTRPALTALFIRILLCTPIWILLTLPPLHILTSQRIVLAFGTLFLSWHSRPARVSRTILWRSRAVRSATTLITGLDFPKPAPGSKTPPALPPRPSAQSIKSPNKINKPGVRFTFTLFENQRRWLGLGWTASLLAYERQAWTDEHLNTTLDTDTFTLPETEIATTRWRWVENSIWRVEGAQSDREKSAKRIGGGGGGDESGWTYYDNKWRDGRKIDGWGRYTRRRKWVRDAELVEVSPSDEASDADEKNPPPETAPAVPGDTDDTASSTARKKTWFARKRTLSGTPQSRSVDTGSVSTNETRRSRDGPEDDMHTPVRYREREWEREIGEGLAEGLG